MMYMSVDAGFDFTMASNICSSSVDRVLRPAKGWAHRQMAA